MHRSPPSEKVDVIRHSIFFKRYEMDLDQCYKLQMNQKKIALWGEVSLFMRITLH